MKGTANYASLQRGLYCRGSYLRDDDRLSSLANREPVAGFSESSRKRLARYIRNSDAIYRVFGTLTYPVGYGNDMAAVKRDIDAFAKRWRRYAAKHWHMPTQSLCWFLEFQSSGRAHVHFYSTCWVNLRWLSRVWYEIVGSSDPRHLRAGTNVKKMARGRRDAMRYAVKYATKSEQKVPPLGIEWLGRYWGVRGLRTHVAASISYTDWDAVDGDVNLALENVSSELRLLGKSGVIDRKVIESEHKGRLVLYFWPIDADPVRMRILVCHERLVVAVRSVQAYVPQCRGSYGQVEHREYGSVVARD